MSICSCSFQLWVKGFSRIARVRNGFAKIYTYVQTPPLTAYYEIPNWFVSACKNYEFLLTFLGKLINSKFLVQDTITGFLLAGVGNVDLRRKTNYLIVDGSNVFSASSSYAMH